MNISHLIKHKSIFPGAKMLLNKDKSLTCLNLNPLNADIDGVCASCLHEYILMKTSAV